jgi:probable F420-dependent oxidoreductase
MGLTVGVRVPCYRRWCTAIEVRAIAQQTEELGFGSLWVQDHLVAPLGTPEETAVQGLDGWMGDATAAPAEPKTLFQYYAGDDWWLDPYVTWGFLAAATSRVKLASDIVVVPYRNPIVQAKMLGTLDVLSQGRMILGTGTGHVRAESAALGVDFDARGRMHDEYLRVIRTLLSSEEASFEGEFFRFGPLRTLIRPVQQPHPPIWVGGHGRRAIRRAAELGDGWLPSMVEPDGLARGIDVLRAACDAIGRAELPTLALSLPSRFRFAGRDGRSSDRVTTPGEAVALLQRYESLGVEHVAIGLAMPTLAVYLEQIETFAAEVLPAFAA